MFRPGDRGAALDAYVLALGGLLLALLVAATREALPAPEPSPLDAAPARAVSQPAQLAELARVEREISLATGTAFDVHYRLRPALREVAEHRLATRRGIDLERAPEAAQAVLGDETWAIVRPDRERPAYHHAPGVTLERVRLAVEALERI